MTDSEIAMPQEENIQWYCIKTKPKNEKLASYFLRTQFGLEVFCPLLRYEKLTATGKKWFQEALFPGYIFARFHYEVLHRAVMSTSGVSKIVSFGGMPAVVQPEIVEQIRNFAGDNEILTVNPTLQKGDDAILCCGAFHGIEVLVKEVYPARQRVAVLMEILGNVQQVEVSVADLLPPSGISRKYCGPAIQ